MYILLVLPFLTLLLIACVVILCLKKWKMVGGMVVIMLLTNSLTETFSIVPLTLFQPLQDGTMLKVECYNIHSGGENFERRSDGIYKQICKADPDFVYLTEYVGICSPKLDSMLKSKYSNHTCSYKRYLETERFYSKWVIDSVYNLEIDTLDAKVRRCVEEYSEVKKRIDRIWVYRIQIHQADDTVALYCCHLDTNNFDAIRDSINDEGMELLKHVSRFYTGIELGYVVRELETDAIYKCLQGEKYPTIVMGDMNDIGGSYTVRRIERAGMTDAWWKGGFGYGCTFHKYGFRFRLAHILYDDRMQLCNIIVHDADLSDHNALSASFVLK